MLTDTSATGASTILQQSRRRTLHWWYKSLRSDRKMLFDGILVSGILDPLTKRLQSARWRDRLHKLIPNAVVAEDYRDSARRL